MAFLLDEKYKVYHVENIHAKVFVFDDKITVGSQNLTNGGRFKNREISVFFKSKQENFEKIISEWISVRKELSSFDVNEIKNALADIQSDFEVFWEKINSISKTLDDAKRNRDLFLENLRRQSNYALSNSTQANEEIIGSVEYVTSDSWNSYSSVYTFKPRYSKEVDFLNWKLGENNFQIQKTYRYLIFLPDSFKLGWARVMKTRITYISSTRDLSFIIKEQWFLIHLTSNWDEKSLSEFNLKITMEKYGFMCEMKAIFTAEKLEILETSFLYDTDTNKLISENILGISKFIFQEIMTPFKYEHNLMGSEANLFFESNVWYKVTVNSVYENRIIIARKS